MLTKQRDKANNQALKHIKCPSCQLKSAFHIDRLGPNRSLCAAIEQGQIKTNDRGRTRTSSGDYVTGNAISFAGQGTTAGRTSTKPVIDLYEVESDRENNEERASQQRKKKAKKSGISTEYNATFDTQHDVGISGASRGKSSNNRRRIKPAIDLNDSESDRENKEERESQPGKKARKSSNLSIQLSAAPDTQHRANILDDIPATIDGIIRYMDKLEPGEYYYDRQKDRRGGCSNTRGKLRNWANLNPTNIAVMHYVETRKWQPPNEEVLLAMVNELKNLIK